jgi:outer membrane lipoprotein-sorting protein
MKKIAMVTMVTVLNVWAISGYEVAKKSDDAVSGFESSVSTMQMVLINGAGEKRVRDMRGETLEKEGGDKSLMEFLSPADVKGTKLLTYQHVDKDDDQWLYLPALKRVKRISSRNKSGSFMGSEFSYEDIASQEVSKYTYPDEAKELPCGDRTCYEVVRIPKDRLSGYTKQVTWIDKDTFLVQKVDYYDRKGALLKTATFSDYKKIDGVWRVGKIEMKNHQNDKETILIWVDDKVKAGLRDKHFSKRILKR